MIILYIDKSEQSKQLQSEMLRRRFRFRYTICDNPNVISLLHIKSLPCLQVDTVLYNEAEAYAWLNEQ